ncbi:MAG: RidA family protein [Chloroflexi bacterium]|nr:RidA family protein [Chloroflexota bacterium]MCH8892249.1 RidA family protein [Chloroflexota bacterium]MCH9017314.1 RidA family protein [Chloroflexota bacterium]MCI0788156.1 RidA family protein [Chloroflexota bacterium]MCI0801341.1 RidA family protein [Chloroflexota bacterium]
MTIERSNPSALANPPGYSHVVKDGTTIYVAGQLARNSAGENVGVGDFSAQAEQAFKNVQAALESVGSDMNHIMKMNVFMTHREDIPEYRIVKARFVPDGDLPVSTLILCSGLADPVFRIEVEVIATMP